MCVILDYGRIIRGASHERREVSFSDTRFPRLPNVLCRFVRFRRVVSCSPRMVPLNVTLGEEKKRFQDPENTDDDHDKVNSARKRVSAFARPRCLFLVPLRLFPIILRKGCNAPTPRCAIYILAGLLLHARCIRKASQSENASALKVRQTRRTTGHVRHAWKNSHPGFPSTRASEYEESCRARRFPGTVFSPFPRDVSLQLGSNGALSYEFPSDSPRREGDLLGNATRRVVRKCMFR